MANDVFIGNLPTELVELVLKGNSCIYKHPKGNIIVMSVESLQALIAKARSDVLSPKPVGKKEENNFIVFKK